MTSEREAYIYIQLPGTLETVKSALLQIASSLNPDNPLGREMMARRFLSRLADARQANSKAYWREDAKRRLPALAQARRAA
jgi:hypothetical protein